MSEHEQEWTPDKVQPPEYPPPLRAHDLERADAPTAWQKLQAERAAAREQMDPRDTARLSQSGDIDRSALQRCLADVEAAAQRLRALLERLSG
jgi:hypothetical protein